MPLNHEIARDPPRTRRFRLIAPVLVLLCLALLAMAPGMLVHISAGEHDGAAPSIGWLRAYDGR
jgi:hypothetical protein